MGGYSVSKWDGVSTHTGVALFPDGEFEAAKEDAIARSIRDPGFAYRVLVDGGVVLYSALNGQGTDGDPDDPDEVTV